MAPQQQPGQQQTGQLQQNSTFIDDNLDTCPSLLNLPESPILPTKNQHYQCRQNHDNNNNNDDGSEERLLDAKMPTTAAHQVGPNHQHHQHHQHYQHQQQSKGNGQHIAGNRRHRHRSISLYGVNSTVEQGHKEIPIWLDDDEPRYVSGVTNKTTCNDIIKALIDDELANGSNNSNSNNNSKPDGGSAASRDYSDYVITERWRGIERSYDGNMAILPVWRAWSRVHNELRLSLKQRRHLVEPPPLQLMPIPPTSVSAHSFSVLKWLKNLLHLNGGNKKQKNKTKTVKTPAKVSNKTKEKCLLAKKHHQMPDELLLVILPDQHYEQEVRSVTNHKLYKLAETRATQRKQRRRRSRNEAVAPVEANNNCIRRRRKDAPLRNSVRNKLAALHSDMNMRYEKEYHLTRQLTEKCKQYKLQNELYTSPEMELSVGQLQRNIEAYAEDIIKTEHELLELKIEMKHDISLINNLKRMTLEHETQAQPPQQVKTVSSDCKVEGTPKKSRDETPQVAKNAPEMQFVDNIYEFCDNNASMLV